MGKGAGPQSAVGRAGNLLSRVLFFCFAAMAAAFVWWASDNLIRETAPGWMVLVYLALGGAVSAGLPGRAMQCWAAWPGDAGRRPFA